MGTLVVITGPIASGKSTVAAALGARLAEDGKSVAAVDLDDLVTSTTAPLSEFDRIWTRAREVHGSLVAAWLSTGMDAVIAHGPIVTVEDEQLLVRQCPDVTPRRAMLRTPFAVAAERVAADNSRAASQDLAFLRSTYDDFERLTPSLGPSDWDFDTSTTTVEAIVERLALDLP